MSKDTGRILERIKVFDAEKAKLLLLRKEEIFNILQIAGGLTLDNNLLAGLAIYASNPENDNSQFLQQLSKLGKNKIPSSKNRNITGTAGKKSTIQPNATKEEQIDG